MSWAPEPAHSPLWAPWGDPGLSWALPPCRCVSGAPHGHDRCPPPGQACGRWAQGQDGAWGPVPPRVCSSVRPSASLGSVCSSGVSGTGSARVLWLSRPGPVAVLPSRALWRRRSWGAGRAALTPGEAQGDAPTVCFQYKVLSVLPGSGMGIAVSTPSTQKVSAGWGPGGGGWARGVALAGGGGAGFWVGAGLLSSGLRGLLRHGPGRHGLPPAPACSLRQPLVFGAMVHRDEAFETIFSQYMKITSAAAAGSDS